MYNIYIGCLKCNFKYWLHSTHFLRHTLVGLVGSMARSQRYRCGLTGYALCDWPVFYY